MIGRIILNNLIKKNTNTTPFLKFIYKKIKRIDIKEILWLDQIETHKILTLKQKKISLCYTPKIYKKNSNNEFISEIPEVNLYKFDEVILNSQSSNIATKNHVIFERVKNADINYCNYATGIIRWHNHKKSILRYNTKRVFVKKALFIGGNGVFNYYHWLIEISPKILQLKPKIIEKYGIKYLIMDIRVKDIPSFQSIIDMYFKEKNINLELIYVDQNTDIFVKDLFYINNASNIVFNSKDVLSSPDFSFVSSEDIVKIRNTVFKHIPRSQYKYPTKIFLARKKDSARSYNQEEILDFFISQGFEAIYLEDHSFNEQINIFRAAEFIVGPSGAAWSNIIFCKSKCKAISWLPYHLSDFSVFSTLAEYNHCDMHFIITNSNNPTDIHSSYSLNKDEIVKLYLSLII